MSPRLRLPVRLFFGFLILAGALVGGVVIWLTASFPRVAPAAPLTVAVTPEITARGKYLFHHLAACSACHSERDPSQMYAPVKPGTEGRGGQRFGAEDGIPGELVASNVTPFALKSWSDGEIRRALVSGVSRDGRALFPLMPYDHYAKLGEDDIAALIAYLRTMPEIAHEPAPSRLDFPMNLIVRTIPRDAEPPSRAPKAGDPGYPAYVANAAACLHCHSPTQHGTPVAGREFSGGVPFQVPGFGTVYSANITPDRTTGIGAWPREAFIARFKMAQSAPPPGAAPTPTVMPWTSYAGMTEDDLGALYDYLHALPAVANQVPRPIPTPK